MMNNRGPALVSRRGITLVELLVVIAVLAVLGGLAAAAVMRVRESTRRMDCSSRLRQVALANLDYHGAHGHFPPNFRPPPSVPWDNVGYFVNLLPFIGETNLSDYLRPYDDMQMNSLKPDAPTVLVCPSEPYVRLQHGSVQMNAGLGFEFGNNGMAPWYQTYTTNDFADGLAHTAAFSERTFYLAIRFEKTEIGNPKAGLQVIRRHFELLPAITECENPPDLPKWDSLTEWYRIAVYHHSMLPNRNSCTAGTLPQSWLRTASSYHSGGVNVAMADGHVKFVTNSVEQRVWWAMGSRDSSVLP